MWVFHRKRIKIRDKGYWEWHKKRPKIAKRWTRKSSFHQWSYSMDNVWSETNSLQSSYHFGDNRISKIDTPMATQPLHQSSIFFDIIVLVRFFSFLRIDSNFAHFFLILLKFLCSDFCFDIRKLGKCRDIRSVEKRGCDFHRFVYVGCTPE